MPDIGLGLGGNVGDPPAAIRAAIEALGTRGIARVAKVSSLYRTAPWGGVPQPDYANACVIGDTELLPFDLLDALKQLERDLGRVETRRWGPRVIDIDILYYGDLSLENEHLVIPHRDLLRRAFVVIPLAEIAPDLVVAGHRITDAAKTFVGDDVKPWDVTNAP